MASASSLFSVALSYAFPTSATKSFTVPHRNLKGGGDVKVKVNVINTESETNYTANRFQIVWVTVQLLKITHTHTLLFYCHLPACQLRRLHTVTIYSQLLHCRCMTQQGGLSKFSQSSSCFLANIGCWKMIASRLLQKHAVYVLQCCPDYLFYFYIRCVEITRLIAPF